MAKQILITFEGKDNVSKTANEVEKAVRNVGKASTDIADPIKNIGKETNNTNDKLNKTFDPLPKKLNATGKHLTDLGSQFRYLSLVAGIAAYGMINLVSSFVSAAKEAEEARFKLIYFAATAGEDLDKVTAAAQRVASTGLVPLSAASNALSNLLATGIGLDKSSQLLDRFLDAASVAKESLQDTLGRALEKASIGFRILQERQVDAIGVNFQLAKDIRETAKALGLNAASLSTAEKQQVLYVFLMKETERYVGAANLATMTFSGSLAKLNAASTLMKATLGNALVPIIGTLAEVLRNVSIKITEFAQQFPGLSSIILIGTTSVVVLTAALAGLAAMLAMVKIGIGVLGISMGAAFGWLTAISAGIGILAYFILKATGQLDKWANAFKNLKNKITETINPIQKMKDEIAKLTEKQEKQVKSLAKELNLVARSFSEDMTEWTKKHDETMSDLIKDINKLEKSYTTATKKIKDDFSKMMASLSLDHARKTEDLQRDIDEEVSKGVWADQTKIRNLQRELKRENEDYALATAEKATKRDEDLKEEKDTLIEKRDEKQKKLDEELALETKHAVLLSDARTRPVLDEVAKITRAYSEKLQSFLDDAAEIKKSTADQILDLNYLGDAINKPINKVAQLRQEFEKANEKAQILSTTGGLIGATISGSLQMIGSKIKEIYLDLGRIPAKTLAPLFPSDKKTILDYMLQSMGSISQGIGNMFKGARSMQEGGIIPGLPSQPVPIMAHGGETVLPAGVAPVTININNPTVRSNSDISRIAEMVKQVLVDNQRYRHVT